MIQKYQIILKIHGTQITSDFVCAVSPDDAKERAMIFVKPLASGYGQFLELGYISNATAQQKRNYKKTS